ncbi:MAG TPA: hypothetical protein VLL97_12525 [Acidobacteriota bacterium]|nr:hypothetical protein [Acidobacteriota bacterium]
MTKTMKDHLRICREQYGEVSIAKYGREFNWQSIEDRVSKELRLIEKRSLTCADLRFFEDEALWPFGMFASLPGDEKLSQTLKEISIDFLHLPKNETKVIKDLLGVLRSIDIVSIILRFVRPDCFGVISPPVERVLDLRRGNNAVDTYCYYLADLRKIAKKFDLGRAANADMALWVLHEKCFTNGSDQELLSAYEEDQTFLHIRVNNLILPLANVSNTRLASALWRLQEKKDIAALIACHELEALIRKMADAFSIPHSGIELGKVINNLFARERIDSDRRKKWNRLKCARNQFFHKGQLPTRDEVNEILSEIESIEQDLESFKAAGPELSPITKKRI